MGLTNNTNHDETYLSKNETIKTVQVCSMREGKYSVIICELSTFYDQVFFHVNHFQSHSLSGRLS